ncbi:MULTISPECIES: hypothetical protein [unclassified Mesorhizobium]|uniref:hypothetical protein n=1 Tax=unclassified Mesorhizobium TaxID=325217 RepID=UPI00109226C5|nr:MULTISPECIES: hypothetical protein [unclassified Mesorhizobium]TGQ01414.1 hypothetical protein EN861_01475 [Mesorhizobium sp. M8A.F.Ca.ET.218.01.1.1]TGT20687.1 hypothetical protein EN856_01480 [Mesorhizobium sp. M8A.F.Ca.ET.213.01.1.1]
MLQEKINNIASICAEWSAEAEARKERDREDIDFEAELTAADDALIRINAIVQYLVPSRGHRAAASVPTGKVPARGGWDSYINRINNSREGLASEGNALVDGHI